MRALGLVSQVGRIGLDQAVLHGPLVVFPRLFQPPAPDPEIGVVVVAGPRAVALGIVQVREEVLENSRERILSRCE